MFERVVIVSWFIMCVAACAQPSETLSEDMSEDVGEGMDLADADDLSVLADLPSATDMSAVDMSARQDASMDADMALPPRVPTCVALTPIGANVDFATPWQVARDAGVTEPGDINVNWNALEPSRGEYLDPDGGVLSMWNTTLSGARVALTLATMQTSEETVPAYLDTGTGASEFARYADVEVADRYAEALDFMIESLPGLNPWVVAVGNEIDIAIATAQSPQIEARVWQDYLIFLERVRERVHTRHPGMLVGVKLGWESVLGGAERVRAHITASDVLIVSYYPSRGNFQVKGIAELAGDVNAMVEMAQGRPIYIAEAGYPSGDDNASSLSQQAEFVAEMLRLHQLHSAQIRTMCFVWMHDLAMEVLDAELERLRVLSEELAMNQAFISFLGTLGLRTETGQDKPAFEVLRLWNQAP